MDLTVDQRWREIADEAEIPGGAYPRLRELLAADGGTTLRAVATDFGITAWTARTWLEKLRAEGTARIEGSGRTARWVLNINPEGPGTMTLTQYARTDILGWASYIVSEEDRRNPVLVTAAASPLLEWASKADDRADLKARMSALRRQSFNGKNGTGDPAGFVEAAAAYYAFITADDPDEGNKAFRQPDELDAEIFADTDALTARAESQS